MIMDGWKAHDTVRPITVYVTSDAVERVDLCSRLVAAREKLDRFAKKGKKSFSGQ